MNYISISGLDKKVSTLILGGDWFYKNNRETWEEVADEYLALGGTTIDTAHIYCGGESEIVLGDWMKARNNREQVVILTKGAHHNKDGPRVNKACIDSELATSLERLQTDYIDLYALHRDDINIPVSHIMDALNEHVSAGRIRAIGVSNWTVDRIQEANEYAVANGLVPFTFSSPNLSLAKQNEPRWTGCVTVYEEDAKWYEAHQMPLLSWSSQAGGFFTGRFSPDFLEDKEMVRVYYSDANWERLRRAEELAAAKGATPIQIALAYVLGQPFPTCALIGTRSMSELRSSYEGSKVTVTPEEVRWLEHGEIIKV